MRIATHYEGPTNTRGSRLVAILKQCRKAPRKSVPYDHALTAVGNHKEAALALFRKLEPSAKTYTAMCVSEYLNRTTNRLTRYWDVQEVKETP